MSLILNRYPAEYRNEVVTPLLQAIQKGESACIVGLAGVGKSNLADFLVQPEVKQQYLPGDVASRTHFVPLSCRPGTQARHDLYNAMSQWVWEIAKDVDEDLENAPAAGIAALQQLRSLLRLACHGLNLRLVFVFDEFECLIRNQPPGFLDDLRQLRDDHRTTGNVVFVIFTHRLPHLVPGPEPMRESKFFGNIREHIYPLPPHRDPDSQALLEGLVEKEDTLSVPEPVRRRLIALSGGHAALLVGLFDVLKPAFAPSAFAPASLLSNSRIRELCADIWTHLHYEEQGALRIIAQGQAVAPEMAEFLRRRGLLGKGNPDALFSNLFKEYIRCYQDPPARTAS